MERRMIGNVEIVALVDNKQAYAVDRVYPEAGTALDRFSAYYDADRGLSMNFGCFLLRDGATTILVDAGFGPEHGGELLAELSAAGVALDSIDIVTFTHLHGDHTGWNIDRSTGKPTFPRARYLVPRQDWDHYHARGGGSFEHDVLPLENLGKLELIDGERALSPSVTSVATPGHTPGHTSFAISSAGQHGFVLGDVVISRIDAEEPGFVTSFDWERLMAVETRRKVIAALVENRALVGASHLPAPGLGRFARDASGTRWEPA